MGGFFLDSPHITDRHRCPGHGRLGCGLLDTEQDPGLNQGLPRLGLY